MLQVCVGCRRTGGMNYGRYEWETGRVTGRDPTPLPDPSQGGMMAECPPAEPPAKTIHMPSGSGVNVMASSGFRSS